MLLIRKYYQRFKLHYFKIKSNWKTYKFENNFKIYQFYIEFVVTKINLQRLYLLEII